MITLQSKSITFLKVFNSSFKQLLRYFAASSKRKFSESPSPHSNIEIEGKYKGLHILIVKKHHHAAMLKHIEEVFSVIEPSCQLFGGEKDPNYIKDTINFAQNGLNASDGLSLVALDSEDQIAGIRISLKHLRSHGLPEPKLGEYKSKNAFRFFKMMYNLEAEVQPNLFDRFGVDELLELRMLSVDPKYWKLGLGSEFYNRNKALAKSKGLKVAKVFLSGEFSKNAAEKSGFYVINSIRYDEYQENGEFILKDMPEPHKMFAMAVGKL